MSQFKRCEIGNATAPAITLPAVPPETPLESRRPVAVDLFAGAGGLSLGLEQAGFDVVAAVEYDPVHAAVHEFNFPRTEIVCADVSSLSAKRLKEAAKKGAEAHGSEWNGRIDAIVGGPPCQGFSSIGKRLVDDNRNKLVFHFFRLVSELQPRYFVMENVPGMARGGHASILERLIEEFQGADYSLVLPPQVLNAADYGVPEDRRRLFLLGARKGEALPAYPAATVRPVPKRGGNVDDGEREVGPTVWDAIGDLPNLDDYGSLKRSDQVRLRETTIQRMEAVASSYARRMRGLDRDEDDLSYPRVWDRRLLTGSQQTVHTKKSKDRFKATKTGETEPVSRFYKLPPEGLCNTLRAGTGSERGAFTSPRPLHPSKARVISVREAARLHSFPDWFRLHETKWHGFRQIGNAVAPLVGRAVGCEVVAALRCVPPAPTKRVELGDRLLLRLNMSQAAERYGADKDSIPAPRTRPSEDVTPMVEPTPTPVAA